MDNNELGTIAKFTALTASSLFAGYSAITWGVFSLGKRTNILDLEIHMERLKILGQKNTIAVLSEKRFSEEDLLQDISKKA